MTLLYYLKPIYHPRVGKDIPFPIRKKKKRQSYKIIRPNDDVRESTAIADISTLAEDIALKFREAQELFLRQQQEAAEQQALEQALNEYQEEQKELGEYLARMREEVLAEIALERKLKRQAQEDNEFLELLSLEALLDSEPLLDQVIYEH